MNILLGPKEDWGECNYVYAYNRSRKSLLNTKVNHYGLKQTKQKPQNGTKLVALFIKILTLC